ncbi:hypothetical protein C1645_815201 [Glomus cerebriforme]|uniref:Uncharacterized protein n=1 Tax=Glomus cerebriforme TaxID=658196 RepID=A0A397TJ61_9GLOM|nr:hypothetical protein C1645_815201 [Glomus cerebriforme]
MTVSCTDCNKPRYLYSFKKISDEEKKIFVTYLDIICYTCEATEDDNVLFDVELEEEINITDEETNPIDNVNTNTKQDDMNQELKNVLSKVFVNAALEYYDEMEKPYYLANFSLLEYIIPVLKKQYSYCETCTKNPNILIKMGRGLNFSSNSAQSNKQKRKRAKKKIDIFIIFFYN